MKDGRNIQIQQVDVGVGDKPGNAVMYMFRYK